jgi:polysaccharide transporter, PST family
MLKNDALATPTGSLRNLVGRGAVAMGLAQGLKFVTQILSVVVLSRLLSPSDFGIMAMVAPVFAFITLFQDLGLTQATIQKTDIRHDEVNYLFWLNVGISLCLAVLLITVAPLIAWFYDEERIRPLVAALSIQLLFYGLAAQHSALISRRMDFGRLATIDVLGVVVTFLASIAWTFVDHSFWALYVGTLVGAVFNAACLWANSKWRPSFPSRVKGIEQLVRFGAGITGFNFANYFYRNLDNILIGRFWGEAQLGLYDRAYKLLLFPLSQVISPLARVMIPALSSLKNEPDRYRNAYQRVVPLLLIIALPGVSFVAVMADVVIPLILGVQWRDSAPIFTALAFAGLLQPLNSPAGWLFVSQGRSGEFMQWGMIAAVTAIIAFAVGLPYGALGVAIAYSVSEYLRTPILWFMVGQRGPLTARDVLAVAMPIVLGAHIAVAILWLARPAFPSNVMVTILLSTFLSYLITILVALLFPKCRNTIGQGMAAALSSLR